MRKRSLPYEDRLRPRLNAAGMARTDRSWPVQVEPGLRDLGEVDEVSILPLVERLTVDGRGLIGEPGVSYLVRAGTARLLFDSGLSGGQARSALAHNAGVPGVDLDARIERILGVTEQVPTLRVGDELRGSAAMAASPTAGSPAPR